MNLRSLVLAVAAFGVAFPLNAANIMLVSDSCAPGGGCEPNQRDDVFRRVPTGSWAQRGTRPVWVRPTIRIKRGGKTARRLPR